jgi:hypothetical protein
MNGESCSHQAVELGWKRLAVGGWMDKRKELENFEKRKGVKFSWEDTSIGPGHILLGRLTPLCLISRVTDLFKLRLVFLLLRWEGQGDPGNGRVSSCVGLRLGGVSSLATTSGIYWRVDFGCGRWSQGRRLCVSY